MRVSLAHLRTQSSRLARITFKDPVSSSTHFVGLIAALVGLRWLLLRVVGPEKTLTAAIYGGTLLLLLLASSCYHFFDLGERVNAWLQRIDHAAIYLFIAGTYLPILLACLDGDMEIGMVSLVCGLAVIGATAKLAGLRLPDAVDAGLYVGMGWVVLFALDEVIAGLSPLELGLLIGGGITYTVGAVVYAKEWPNPFPGRFAHHEVWHVLVLMGAGSHFVVVSSILG